MKAQMAHPRRRGRVDVGANRLRASLVHRDVRREQDGQDRRRARAVHVPQSARLGARHGARRERRDAALGRRMGRRRRVDGPRRHARIAEARRQGRHHGQPRAATRSITASACAACCGRRTDSAGASRARPSIDAARAHTESAEIDMNRALRLSLVCGLAFAASAALVTAPRRAASARRAGGGADHGASRCAVRHHGPLGLADHGRLGVSDDHAGERRRVVRPVERRRPPARRSVGSRARRGRRRAVQRLRGSRDHAVAEPRRDLLARRQHPEARHRHGHADARVPLRPDASRKARAAGKDGRRRRGSSRGRRSSSIPAPRRSVRSSARAA